MSVGTVEPVDQFDGARQKELFERLDTIAAALRSPDLALPELLEVLSTLYGWRMSPQVWKTVSSWCRSRGGNRSVGCS